MRTRTPATVTITARSSGGFDVAWREGKTSGAVPVKTRATAMAIQAAILRGVPPIEAVSRAMRPKRRPKIGETAASAAKYGRLGAAARAAAMTPERRQEIARGAARARWGTKETR